MIQVAIVNDQVAVVERRKMNRRLGGGSNEHSAVVGVVVCGAHGKVEQWNYCLNDVCMCLV